MTYTINGKDYTKLDISVRCAELLGIDSHVVEWDFGWMIIYSYKGRNTTYEPCNKPEDAWPIIEKCWDELMCVNDVILGGGVYSSETEWDEIIGKYDCTKLTAACICLIEINS